MGKEEEGSEEGRTGWCDWRSVDGVNDGEDTGRSDSYEADGSSFWLWIVAAVLSSRLRISLPVW